jgi:hypothetical protein
VEIVKALGSGSGKTGSRIDDCSFPWDPPLVIDLIEEDSDEAREEAAGTPSFRVLFFIFFYFPLYYVHYFQIN